MEISPETTVEDLVRTLPASVRILSRHGLVCIRCGEPYWGTLQQLAAAKGDVELGPIVEELRQAARLRSE